MKIEGTIQSGWYKGEHYSWVRESSDHFPRWVSVNLGYNRFIRRDVRIECLEEF